MIILDTNTIIRFFTRDHPKHSTAAAQLIRSADNLSIPDVVFPELEYVLRNVYKTSRRDILALFKFLIAQDNIFYNYELKFATQVYEESVLDMADCIIVAYARKGELASFDQDLLKVKGASGYWNRNH